MKCENCKGEFDFPLELYNGEIACPLCKKAMTLPAVKNNVGQEEDANFNRGEAYYKMSLTCTNAAEKKQYSAMAVESTRLAAQGGHPKRNIALACPSCGAGRTCQSNVAFGIYVFHALHRCG